MGEKKLFCFGYGYTCEYLGHELANRGGWKISGTTRDQEKKADMESRGIEAHIFDVHSALPDLQHIMDGATHLLISVQPGAEGDPAFLMHAEDIVKVPSLEWVGYLSTTGVYGDRDGEWVDETDMVQPSSQRGSRRVKAERQWLSLLKSDNLPVHIFRLSGIYGPGRSALDSVRAGVARRIHKPDHVFGRIHVEDIVRVLMASIENPAPGEIYNVTDDYPAPSHEIIEYACELLGRPPPPMVEFEEAHLAPITRSFYTDSKRVKNDKIKDVLGVDLKYPSFREGLKGCLDAEQHALSLFKGMTGS